MVRLDPASGNAQWHFEDSWQPAALESEQPERHVPAPLLGPGFAGPAGSVPAGWIPLTEPFFSPGEWAAAAEPPRTGDRGCLQFPAGFSSVCRAVTASPLTSYVLRIRVQGARTPGALVGVVLATLRSPPDGMRSEEEVRELWSNPESQSGEAQWIGAEAVARGAVVNSRGVVQGKAALLSGPDGGSEEWRYEFSTGFGVHSLLVGLVAANPDGAAISFSDLSLHELTVAAGLRWSRGHFPALPGSTGVDLDLRQALVRSDGASRRATLLGAGGRARCRFPLAPGSRSVEVAACIVAEDRLTRDGPLRESLRAELLVDGKLRAEEELALVLEPGVPHFWAQVRLDLPAASGAPGGQAELRLAAGSSGAERQVLIAVAGPLLRVCPAAAAPSVPNLVLVSLDTLRADRIGKVRDGASLTPHLDALARESTVFTQALAPASYTLPSHVSMFTSQIPTVHGMLHPARRLDPGRSATFTEIVARAGYATAAFTAGAMLNPEFSGIARGFDVYTEFDPLLTETDPLPSTVPRWDAAAYNRKVFEGMRLEKTVLPWIRDHAEVPFFLFLHTYLVHNYHPGRAAEERCIAAQRARGGEHGPGVPLWEREVTASTVAALRPDASGEFVASRDLPYLEALYDATVQRADAAVGRLLAELEAQGVRDRTIVVVVADHGEEFLEHGGLSHARTLYDEILRVPWILHVPGRAAATVEAPVSLVDLAPTLLELLELPADARMHGVSALRATEERATVHEGIEGAGVLARAARTPALKVIVQGTETPTGDSRALSAAALHALGALGYLDASSPDPQGLEMEVYDLSTDPGETRNRYGEALLPREQAGLEELLHVLQSTELP